VLATADDAGVDDAFEQYLAAITLPENGADGETAVH
jgi:hypothetical protein